ncbi:MAG: glycosyltransferase [Lysobacteraceae bacterium]|nr:MAG: glycosyltransferase [Xanthomonadaceae bacterium]
MKDAPLTAQIDVLMSTYNAGRFLPETLASIQAQTIRDIRIIIVDDGSTDNSPELLAQAARQDPRIHVITQANGGIVAALNAGLAACTAPFIARHDADDLSNPDRFERQIRYLEANPDCVAVAGAARQIDVLMSTYNAGRFLPETLASIQAQTIRDIRIIIVAIALS